MILQSQDNRHCPPYNCFCFCCCCCFYFILVSFFSDEKAACGAIGGLLKENQKWNVVGCEVVCCTGDKCNTQNPTLPYPGSGGDFEELISC